MTGGTDATSASPSVDLTEDKPAVNIVSPPPKEGGLRDVLLHSILPFLFGAIIGSLWQFSVVESLNYGVPNPPQFANLTWMVVATLCFPIVWKHESGSWQQYLFGCSVLVIPLFGIWMTGYGSLVCGAYLSGISWIVISASWPRYEYPPFRYGIWHVLGVNIGAFFGSVLAFNLM